MKKALLIVAMLLSVVPVMATTTITAVNEGVVQTPDSNYMATVRIDYSTTDANVRAFALDINIESGPAFQRIRDFKTGESNAVSPGYGIFPSRFRDFIVVTGPNWVDTNYNPTVAWNEPGTLPDHNSGMGWPQMIVEMGALYSGEANKPAMSGTLFRFDVNGYSSVGTYHLKLAANALRGGVVGGDGNSLTPVLVGCDIVFPASGCTVPNVVGQAEATATANIVAAGFTTSKSGEARSDTIAAGNVISTDPAYTGTPITCGTNVTYVKSLGPCVVPNVVNMFETPVMNATNATTTLTNAGFTLGTRTTAASATIAAGKVISTTPASGATPGCGTAVAYQVSTGPATCATCVGDLVVSSFFNLSDMYNLRGKLTTAYNRTTVYQVDMGSAVTGDQWHVCGNTVTSGGNVLNLSDMYNLRGRLTAGFTAGGLYQAPFVPINVPRKTEAQMRTAITTSNLVVGTVTYAGDPTVPNGYVISTTPAYPTYRNCNTTVDILVDNTTP